MWWLRSPKRKFTIPDWFSIYRILAVPLLITILLLDERFLFGVFIGVSFATDAIDGFLARRMNVVSQRGAQLDSIGDALTFAMGVVGILKFEWEFVLEHWTFLTVALGLYLVQLGMAYWRYGMPSSFHTYLAKVSAVFQGVFMIYTFLIGVENWLFYSAVVIGVVETIEEVLLIIHFPDWKANVKGLYWVIRDKA